MALTIYSHLKDGKTGPERFGHLPRVHTPSVQSQGQKRGATGCPRALSEPQGPDSPAPQAPSKPEPCPLAPLTTPVRSPCPGPPIGERAVSFWEYRRLQLPDCESQGPAGISWVAGKTGHQEGAPLSEAQRTRSAWGQPAGVAAAQGWVLGARFQFPSARPKGHPHRLGHASPTEGPMPLHLQAGNCTGPGGFSSHPEAPTLGTGLVLDTRYPPSQRPHHHPVGRCEDPQLTSGETEARPQEVFP